MNAQPKRLRVGPVCDRPYNPASGEPLRTGRSKTGPTFRQSRPPIRCLVSLFVP